MTSYDWHTERDKAIAAFDNELPNAITEDVIKHSFLSRPQVVVAVLADVAELKRNGKARSGWAVAKSRIATLDAQNVTAEDTADRDLKTRIAATWIHHAGLLMDREDEILATLFDPGGILHPWHGDVGLQERMLDTYRQQRGRGKQVEAEVEARALRWVSHRGVIKDKPRS